MADYRTWTMTSMRPILPQRSCPALCTPGCRSLRGRPAPVRCRRHARACRVGAGREGRGEKLLFVGCELLRHHWDALGTPLSVSYSFIHLLKGFHASIYRLHASRVIGIPISGRRSGPRQLQPFTASLAVPPSPQDFVPDLQREYVETLDPVEVGASPQLVRRVSFGHLCSLCSNACVSVGVKRCKKSYRHGTTGILVALIAFPACQERHSARGMKAYKEHGTSRAYQIRCMAKVQGGMRGRRRKTRTTTCDLFGYAPPHLEETCVRCIPSPAFLPSDLARKPLRLPLWGLSLRIDAISD